MTLEEYIKSHPQPQENGMYDLYISARVAWNLRTYGRQKRRKGFNLKRDLPAYYP